MWRIRETAFDGLRVPESQIVTAYIDRELKRMTVSLICINDLSEVLCQSMIGHQALLVRRPKTKSEKYNQGLMTANKEGQAMKCFLAAMLTTTVVGFSSVQTLADGPEEGFPGAHQEFLGAASYMAIHGPSPEGMGSAPYSSDAGKGRPPRVGTNLQVNDPQFFPFGRNEATVAATSNGHYLVIGWNDGEGFCGPPFSDLIPLPCDEPATPGFSGYGYSGNGGKSFVDGGAPPVGDRIGFGPGPSGISITGEYITLGDPSLDVGGYGNDTFYYANLAEFLDQIHIGLGPDPTAGIAVHVGGFGKGGNFSWHEVALLQSPNYPRDFLDKEHIAADKRGESNRLYVSVSNFMEVGGVPFFGFGQIEVYHSPDGGLTWDRSVVQPDETISMMPAPGGTGVVNQGSQPAIGPDGTAYVAWERGFLYPLTGSAVTPEIRVARSTDDGLTWMPEAILLPSSGVNPAGTLVSKICAGALYPPAGYNRSTSNDFPRIAVAQNEPHQGRVYVVWNDCRIANGGTQEYGFPFGNPDTDIYLAYSDDRGETWSEPTLVSGGGDDRIQFWPTISVQPGGNVDIVYYESVEMADPDKGDCVVPIGPGGAPPFKISAERSLVDVYYAQSSDGGATFRTPIRITEETTDWCSAIFNATPNFGDYNTAVSVGNSVIATWTDGRNNIPDIFFAKINTRGKASW